MDKCKALKKLGVPGGIYMISVSLNSFSQFKLINDCIFAGFFQILTPITSF